MKKALQFIYAFFNFLIRGRMPSVPTQPDMQPPSPPVTKPPDSLVIKKTPDDSLIIPEYSPGGVSLHASTAKHIIAYMEHKGYEIDRNWKNGNIVYISGMSDVFGRQENRHDEWNDLRLIIQFDLMGEPRIDFFQMASVEPGTISRHSQAARRMGGVATIVSGQYKAWKTGYHKGNKKHPALIQVAPITIWRDKNVDGKSSGERLYKGLFGINQHSTSPGFSDARVGKWSAGCAVGKEFFHHLLFMRRIMAWECYKQNPNMLFTTTFIDGEDFFGGSWRQKAG